MSKVPHRDVFLFGLRRSALTCVQLPRDPLAVLETAWWTAAHVDYILTHQKQWASHYLTDHARTVGFGYGVYQAVRGFLGEECHAWSLESQCAAESAAMADAAIKWRNLFVLDIFRTPASVHWTMTQTPICTRSPVGLLADMLDKEQALCTSVAEREMLEVAAADAVREMLRRMTSKDNEVVYQTNKRMGREEEVDALFDELRSCYYLACERLGAISQKTVAPTIPAPLVLPPSPPSPSFSSPPSTP